MAFKLARKKPSDLKLLHQTLFGRKGKAVDFKNHILQFSGFAWHESDEKQKARIREKLDKCVKDSLLDLCDLLDISISTTSARKEDLIVKLLDFMVAPHATTDVLLAEQECGPIERVRKQLLAHDIATANELKDIEKQARKEVDDAIAQAKESPQPDPSELFTIVYVKGYGVEVFGADRKEDHLGDVSVELHEVGAIVTKGKNFGVVETVEATSDVYKCLVGWVGRSIVPPIRVSMFTCC